jgi:hypothetical protein
LNDYTIRMDVYGGITPEELDRIPQWQIHADILVYNARAKVDKWRNSIR